MDCREIDKCVEKLARDMCVRRPTKQTQSDTVGIRKRAAREMLFSLLEYDLPTRRTRAEDDTELEEEVKNHMNEAGVRLGGDSKSDVRGAWRMKPIKDIA